MHMYVHSQTHPHFHMHTPFPWRETSVSPEKWSPATPMHGPGMAAAREEAVTGCHVWRSEGSGRVRRKATVPGLTYQPEQRSPTGSQRQGEEAERRRRTGEGERQTRITCH